jgi:hypothetical protein
MGIGRMYQQGLGIQVMPPEQMVPWHPNPWHSLNQLLFRHSTEFVVAWNVTVLSENLWNMITPTMMSMEISLHKATHAFVKEESITLTLTTENRGRVLVELLSR